MGAGFVVLIVHGVILLFLFSCYRSCKRRNNQEESNAPQPRTQSAQVAPIQKESEPEVGLPGSSIDTEEVPEGFAQPVLGLPIERMEDLDIEAQKPADQELEGVKKPQEAELSAAMPDENA